MRSGEKYAVCDDVVSETLGREEVLLHVATGTYFQLNATGAIVWQLLKGAPHSRSELVDHVVARVSGVPAGVDSDVEALLGALLAERLIQVVS